MASDGVRWGVVGPGGIAARFGEAMTQVEDGSIVAVSSRSIERADAFGDRFGVPRRYADDEALAADDEVDAVYVATPNNRHLGDALRFLEAGKHVLCEKPLALDAAEARTMVAAARERGLFLMEAIWSRFLPAYRLLVDVVGSGRIGDVLLVEADFGFRRPVDPAHRLFDRALGGGARLDLGIYPVQLCHLLLGAPTAIAAEGVIGPTGVDELVAAVLRHEVDGRDAVGVVKAAIRTPMTCTARIAGTKGVIDLPAFMHCPDAITISAGGQSERLDASWEGDGLAFEIREVHRCLAEGLTESPTMTLDESIAIATTLDDIASRLRPTA